jgi:chromosome partitioning protein
LVEVRHYRTAVLKHQSVAAFVGNLALAGVKRGYLVTTSTFTAPARAAAAQAGQRGYSVCLTDWRHLTRYLAYLRGSRITGVDGRKRTPLPTPPDCLHAADATPRCTPRQTAIVAIANNRGGVAKTTSALSLALALVAKKQRVLLVDLDGQANLTLALPPPVPRLPRRGQPAEAALPERTIVEFFAGRAPLADLVRPTRHALLWVLSGDGELYTRAALAAVHGIVLPTIVEPFAVRSINRLLETAQTLHGLMGRDGRVLGTYAVRWPRRPSQQLRSQLAALKQAALLRDVRDVQHPHSRGWAHRCRQPAADPGRPRRYLRLPQQRRSSSLSGALGGDRREVVNMTTTTASTGAAADGTALTPAERTSRALTHAQATLPEGTNGKLLQAVLLEVAAAALADDPAFAARVRARYAEVAPPPAKRATTKGGSGTGSTGRRAPRATPKVSDLLEPLVPIKHIPNYEITVEGPLDPYLLLEVFGAHQLARALNQRSAADLQKAVALVQARHPSTGPERKSGKASKPALIAYIVEQVISSTPTRPLARPIVHD